MSTINLQSFVKWLSRQVRQAGIDSNLEHQEYVLERCFQQDGTAINLPLQVPQGNGALNTVDVPLISLLPGKSPQLEKVCLQFEAGLANPVSLVDELEWQDFELSFSPDSGSGFTPATIKIWLGNDEHIPTNVTVAIHPGDNEPTNERHRMETERELRMIAVDRIGGFSMPADSTIFINQLSRVHFAKPASKNAWRISASNHSRLSLLPETLEAFENANQNPRALSGQDFLANDLYQFRFVKHDLPLAKTHEADLETFPIQRGKRFRVVEMSQLGWSNDGSEALLYIGWLTPLGNGRGRFLLFRQQGTQYSCRILPLAPSWNK